MNTALGELTLNERGFTYIYILLLVALMSAILASTATVWHSMSKRDKERELLFVGHAFRKAIGLYYERSPSAVKQYPRNLEDLLLDKRHTGVARYLRRIYVDPMTGKKEWGLIRGAGDGIVGVYSLSPDTPIKVSNFEEANKDFKGKVAYSEWRFVYSPKQIAQQIPAHPTTHFPTQASTTPVIPGMQLKP